MTSPSRILLVALGLGLSPAAFASTTVTFDDRSAPCLFIDAFNPGSFYVATYGLTLVGNWEVLNQCGNFSVSGYSAPNFLAWNSSAGTGTTESLRWSSSVSNVSLLAAASGGGTIFATAYNSAGAVVGSTSRALSSAAGTVSLPFSGITRVDLSVTAGNGIIDNVTWTPFTDADGDGSPSGTDCNDADASIYPGAPETCDGRDQDCDGLIDEGLTTYTYFRDSDGDSFGSSASGTTNTCSTTTPSGFSNVSTDCNDGNRFIYPGAPETCDGVDQDCDSVVDDGLTTYTYYRDADGDAYGATSSGVLNTCAGLPSGYSNLSTDCNDANASINPGATEICDGIDQDCDTVADDGLPTTTYYRDLDADTFGAASSGTTNTCASSAPSGYSVSFADCNDFAASIYPGAPEICDLIDQDCDSVADDGLPTSTFYRDLDADTFGAVSSGTTNSCFGALSGYSLLSTDCDDTNATVYPGAAETPYDGIDQDCALGDWVDVDGDGYSADVVGGPDCHDRDAAVYPGSTEGIDGVDEDCDGLVDDGTSAFDDDGDGFSEDGGDCDDGDAAVSPLGVETVDGIDEDCDGIIDEDTDASDDDGDGRSEWEGDCDDTDPGVGPGTTEILGNGIDDDCDGVVDAGDTDGDGDGVTASGGDCDDTSADTRPGATELPDGADNDCDGITDEDTVLSDDDGDGFTEDGGDCDDGDAAVNPEAVEEVNGVDDDCDGLIDDGTDVSDDDGDGFSEEGGDCDDGNPEVHPGAEELPDGLDNDCDGSNADEADDADGDGVTAADGDCDDTNGWVSPDTVEMCDGVDNNCNGEIDEDCEDVANAGGLSKRPGGACATLPGGGAPLALPALGLALGLVLRRRRR